MEAELARATTVIVATVLVLACPAAADPLPVTTPGTSPRPTESDVPTPAPTTAPIVTPSAAPTSTLTPTQPWIWTDTGSMVDPRNCHTATLLGDGRVLVAGGYSDTQIGAAELYDPVTRS